MEDYMKKKKILSFLAIIILAFCVFIGFKNLFSYVFTNKFHIKVKSADTFYAGSNIEMLVSLESDDYKSNKNVNYKFKLFDSNNKKVKKHKIFVEKIKNDCSLDQKYKIINNRNDKHNFRFLIKSEKKQRTELSTSANSKFINFCS